MTWLLESPVWIIVIGLATAAILGGVWLQTGQKLLLYGLLIALALTCGLVFLERAIETDREQITATLDQIARDVERNDLDALLAHIDDSAPAIRRQAAAEMPQYDFEQVNIKRIWEISVDRNQQPPTATVEFNVVVVGSRGDLVKGRRVPRYCVVTFVQDGETWRVTDYTHDDPQVGFQKRN